DKSDEYALRAERPDIAGDIAGAADLGFAACNCEHRGWRFGGNPAHLPVDEIVEHEIADAEHGLPRHKLQRFIKIEHVYCCEAPYNPRSYSAIAMGAIEITVDVAFHRSFERHEVRIISGAPEVCGLSLGKILIAVADRCRHVDIFDRWRAAERGEHCMHQIAEAARHTGADIEDAADRRRLDQPAHDRDRVLDIDEVALLFAIGN